MHIQTHNHPLSRLRLGLGIAGLIPFVFFALLAASPTQMSQLPFEHALITSWSHPEFELFVAYSAIILSFMAGTLWGKSLDTDISHFNQSIIIVSNIVAILAWAVLIMELINLNALALICLSLGFCSLLMVEVSQKTCLYGENADAYIRYRSFLTTIVIACHALMFFSIY